MGQQATIKNQHQNLEILAEFPTPWRFFKILRACLGNPTRSGWIKQEGPEIEKKGENRRGGESAEGGRRARPPQDLPFHLVAIGPCNHAILSLPI